MKNNSCRICDKEILVSASDFDELCIVCGGEFREMMIAVGELSVEIAAAHSSKERGRPERTMPGIPMEEIAMRMQLNRIREKS